MSINDFYSAPPCSTRSTLWGSKVTRVDRLNGIAEQFLMVQFAENTQVCEPLSHKELILIHTVGLNASTLYVRFRRKLGVVLIILS